MKQARVQPPAGPVAYAMTGAKPAFLQPRPAMDVANFFVEYSGYTKTHLQIQKLTYVAHGYMLGVHGVPLIRDPVQAWKHGPVIPQVYRAFKHWERDPIGSTTYRPEPFAGPQQEILENVFAHYGRFCGYFLSDITRSNSADPTPWQRCHEPEMDAPIQDSVTKAYYRELYRRAGYEY